jgi:hypothetical protein
MKIFIIIFIALCLSNCVTYKPEYMESKTTGERITDVIILMGFGAAIGITIYDEVK